MQRMRRGHASNDTLLLLSMHRLDPILRKSVQGLQPRDRPSSPFSNPLPQTANTMQIVNTLGINPHKPGSYTPSARNNQKYLKIIIHTSCQPYPAIPSNTATQANSCTPAAETRKQRMFTLSQIPISIIVPFFPVFCAVSKFCWDKFSGGT